MANGTRIPLTVGEPSCLDEVRGNKLRSKRIRPVMLHGVALLLLSGALATWIVISGPSDEVRWILLNLLAILIFSSARGMFRRVDFTEAIHWMNGVFVVMFVLHPAAVLSLGLLGTAYHHRFDIAPLYGAALSIGFAAIVATNVGYGIRQKYVESFDTMQNRLDSQAGAQVVRRGAAALTVVGSAAAIYGAASGGGIESAFSRSAGSTSAYIYMAPLVLVPAACMWWTLYAISESRKDLGIGLLLVTFLVVVPFIAGQRTGVLTGLVAPVSVLVLTARKRIGRWLVMLLVFMGLLVFAALRDVNSPTGGFLLSIDNAVADPVAVALESVSGSDAEMVDALALEMQAVPGYIGHRPGLVLLSSLGAVIPRALWPGKPLTADVILNGHFLGAGVNDASVAYSIFGEAYLDSGLIGVVLLGLTIGIFYRKAYSALLRGRSDGLVVAVYSVLVPLSITLLRGVLAYTLAYALFVVVPLLIVGWFVGRASRDATSGRTCSSVLGR